MIEMPEAFHTATDDLPYADDWAGTPGIRLKLLMADIEGRTFRRAHHLRAGNLAAAAQAHG